MPPRGKNVSLRGLERLGAGIECTCYALSATRVLKVYSSKRARDAAWRRQVQAKRAGLGPSTHGRVRTTTSKFAYVSQRAEPVDQLSYADERRLTVALEKIGLTGRDLGYSNVGRVGGRLVCIDFGDESMGHLSWDSGGY